MIEFDIPGFDGNYKITKNGEVISYFKNRKVLKKIKKDTGFYVKLSKNKKQYDFRVEELMALTFFKEYNSKLKVGFKDDNKSNLVLDNLYLYDLNDIIYNINCNGKSKQVTRNYILHNFTPIFNESSYNYLIDKYGNIFSKKYNKFISQKLNGRYYIVYLKINNKLKIYKVGDIVANTFINKNINQNKLCYKDFNTLNHYAENLEWYSDSIEFNSILKTKYNNILDFCTFKEYPEFPEYYINIIGDVYNSNTGYMYNHYTNSSGYLFTILTHNNKSYNRYIHRLVAITHISNPNNLSQVNHINGREKYNNHISNLEWNSSKDNINNAINQNLINPTKSRINSTPLKITNNISNEVIFCNNITQASQILNIDRKTVYNYLHDISKDNRLMDITIEKDINTYISPFIKINSPFKRFTIK